MVFIIVIVFASLASADLCQMTFSPFDKSLTHRIIDQCFTENCWLATEIGAIESAAKSDGMPVTISFEVQFLRSLYWLMKSQILNEDFTQLEPSYPFEQVAPILESIGLYPESESIVDLNKESVDSYYETANFFIQNNSAPSWADFLERVAQKNNVNIQSAFPYVSSSIEFMDPLDLYFTHPSIRANSGQLQFNPMAMKYRDRSKFERLIRRSLYKYKRPIKFAMNLDHSQIVGPLIKSPKHPEATEQHSMLIVDIVKNKYKRVIGFVAQNSWGSKSGVNGYFIIDKKTFYSSSYLAIIPSWTN